ncbi:MAG: carbamoyltransferase HypF [Bacteroidetes bacterium CG18_big_fil_WC_8_21_14_2_50_41_14]|nr:MAG: carbamoyltransferase HypF [Bacteroidetes bacterium CG18_big_fil_WC_8_21_14_2_50_41_14]PJB59619.1 MAG: carbamoyltransferase HypF [Bacteroidetes bacterium CG_4_9_14_3_um_filter_41_19]
MIVTKKIEIKGLVQGVGFRPAIYRIAMNHLIKGTVENTNAGVIIVAEGLEKQVDSFINILPDQVPVAANITSINIERLPVQNYPDFKIIKSSSNSDEITQVSPDIAVCEDCLDDLKHQPHRINYPLTNCTNCGPRFTIIKSLPYDRLRTTMAPFEMCPTCRDEYTNVLNRRFHAQPVACNDCGPKYTLLTQHDQITDFIQLVKAAALMIDSGKLLAIKGMGGFHLACAALNREAVLKMRELKCREGKPFALMVRDLTVAEKFVILGEEERRLLTSWHRPIVLATSLGTIPSEVAMGLNSVGIMLPYMPFHHLLFEQMNSDVLVFTSGNFSDEPIIIQNEEGIKAFLDKTAAVIFYNREIVNRTDDSVAFVVNRKSRLIRRSRGYAPSPVNLNLNMEGIFAAGAELVNCFAIGKGTQAIMSQHIGDLKNMETLDFYSESIERFSQLFRFVPILAVADLHPDYLSTRYAEEMNIPLILVQHHHAHMASCMAEHGLTEKVIGICFDGTGLGTDGHIWGGEFLYGDLLGFERFSHFEYIPQPGGDAVTKHPWRMMVSYLVHYFGTGIFEEYPFILEGIDKTECNVVVSMINNKINTPLTSSTGRLFDAVSALLGICRHAAYHAEAPMQLEAVVDPYTDSVYSWIPGSSISFKPLFRQILDDLSTGISVGEISGKFHNTLVEVVVTTAKTMRTKLNTNMVVLSGGSFQNKMLLQKTENKLKDCNFAVYSQEQVPSNDGGIALGQLAIAAQRRLHNRL